MKRFFKICSVMVILFLVAGIGFLIAAWRGGATIPAVMDNVIENFKDEETASQYSFGSQGIRKLEIDIGGGNLKIQQGASDEISLENNGKSWVRAEVKDSGETLKIDEGRFASWLRRFWKPRGTAVLTLPENMKLEELDIDCGSGDMTAQNISGDEISVDCGSGDIMIDALRGNDVSIDCGSGDIEIGLLKADTIENDIGSGNLTLMLAGTEDDYHYEIDCGSGDAHIGSRNYSGVKSSYQGGAGSKSLELDSGSGDVRIDFKEDK